MTDPIEALARECAEELHGTGERAQPHVRRSADLIARRVRAYLRPEGAVPVRCKVAWSAAGPMVCSVRWEPVRDDGYWKRVDTITAYLAPPQPEAGHEAEGVADA